MANLHGHMTMCRECLLNCDTAGATRGWVCRLVSLAVPSTLAHIPFFFTCRCLYLVPGHQQSSCWMSTEQPPVGACKPPCTLVRAHAASFGDANAAVLPGAMRVAETEQPHISSLVSEVSPLCSFDVGCCSWMLGCCCYLPPKGRCNKQSLTE